MPGLPVALFAAHGDKAVPLGGVPAVAPGDSPAAVDGVAVSRWPIEGVDAATPTAQALEFTGSVAVQCMPSGKSASGAAHDAAIPDGTLVVAPAGWSNGLVSWPNEGPDEALTGQLTALEAPTDKVIVANAGDLDGDGQPDRLVFAAGPQVDPEKPAATMVFWWGNELAPLQGFEFNGAVQALFHLATPAGPLIVLRSQWMGGSGLHALVVEGSKPRALGEWVCGT